MVMLDVPGAKASGNSSVCSTREVAPAVPMSNEVVAGSHRTWSKLDLLGANSVAPDLGAGHLGRGLHLRQVLGTKPTPIAVGADPREVKRLPGNQRQTECAAQHLAVAFAHSAVDLKRRHRLLTPEPEWPLLARLPMSRF